MSTPIKIIIAEDDPQIAEIQQRFLERIEGVELLGVAHTLVEAKDLLQVFQPNLILLDIQFPEGSGLELLTNIRSNNTATDVILITAAREVQTLTTALRNGVFDYILKPLNFSRLEASINKYRTHLEKLASLEKVAQSQVDEFINPSTEKISTEEIVLPKGIDAITLDSIRLLFKDKKDMLTAENVSQQIGSGRTTARRYLEYLVATKVLIANVSYGTVGRPERRYSLKS
ncbi:MAG: response regulator [Arenicella sp.]